MKKVLICLLISFCVLPLTVFAASKKYQTLNLKEALEEEQIESKLGDYKETDKQITIYLFRGKGCGFCRSFLNFLNDITEEYGKYFKVVSYETWYNKDNYTFMNEVSTFLGQPATGVPYIIIGDQVFPGYSSQYDESIKKAITDLYNSKDRYDVLDELEKSKKVSNTSVNYLLIIGSIAGTIVLGTICIIYCDYKQHHILYNRISSLEGKINNFQTMKVKETIERKEVSNNKKVDTTQKKVKAVKKTAENKKNKK